MEGASLLRAGENILIEVVRQLLPFYDCKAKKKPSIYLLGVGSCKVGGKMIPSGGQAASWGKCSRPFHPRRLS
jgi:hypothetical protein